MHMTLRKEIEMGCRSSSYYMFALYYYSSCLCIIEMLSCFTLCHDVKKGLESHLTGKTESSHNTETIISAFADKVEHVQLKR